MGNLLNRCALSNVLIKVVIRRLETISEFNIALNNNNTFETFQYTWHPKFLSCNGSHTRRSI